MTVQMALNIEVAEQPQTTIAETVVEPSAEVQPNQDIMAILLADESELREPLIRIQEELAQYIGPVAELVFKDSVEIWATNNTPSSENLPELISMMELEIDDEDDRNNFLDSLKSKEEE